METKKEWISSKFSEEQRKEIVLEYRRTLSIKKKREILATYGLTTGILNFWYRRYFDPTYFEKRRRGYKTRQELRDAASQEIQLIDIEASKYRFGHIEIRWHIIAQDIDFSVLVPADFKRGRLTDATLRAAGDATMKEIAPYKLGVKRSTIEDMIDKKWGREVSDSYADAEEEE